jgi:hypothetical protein
MPLPGLPYEFLDDSYMDAVEAALREARAAGLKVWIWDDWIFPSGYGGGLVTADPQYRARRLYLSMDVILEPGQSLSITAPPRTISAGAVPVDKHGGPAGAYEPLPVAPGQALEHRTGEQRERLFLVTWAIASAHQLHVRREERRHYSVDMLSRRATERFIEVAYEPFARRFKEYFGNTIEGFFNDEPTQAFPFPWTGDFAEVFQARKGYDIRPQLPFLLGCLQGQSTSPGPGPVMAARKTADDYLDVWTDLVAENFMGPLEAWCHQHELLLLGNLDMEHRLYNLATVSGHFFKNNARNDYPSLDVIYEQILPDRFTDHPRYAGSVARLLGKPRASSESLAAMGSGMNANEMRYVLDHQFVRGVTHFFLMRRDYQPELTRNMWPPDLSPANPVAAAFLPVISERTGRLSTLMNAGQSMVDTLLYLPMHDIAALQYFMNHPHAGNNRDLPWESVDRIVEYLAYLPCEFDYAWDEALLELELANGGLRSKHGHTYRTLIFPAGIFNRPPGCTIKPAVAKRLQAFRERGGRLLAVDQAPPAITKWVTVCRGLDDLGRRLVGPIQIEGDRQRITLSARTDGKHDWHLLLNEESRPVEVIAAFSREGQLVELEPSTGALRQIHGEDIKRVPLRFASTQLRVLVLDRSSDLQASPAPHDRGKPLVLPQWRVHLPDGKSRGICDPLPDWSVFGLEAYSGWITYTTTFNWNRPETTARLNLGDVAYAAEVRLNDDPTVQAPFQPFELSLSGLKPGNNRLQVRVLNTLANRFVFDKKPYSWRILDQRKLRSGLFGPVTLTPISSEKDR